MNILMMMKKTHHADSDDEDDDGDDDDDDEFLVPCMIHGAAQAFSEPTNSSCPWLVRIESRSM